MSEYTEELSIKMDADLSEFNNKIDDMENKISSLKKEIEAVSQSISIQMSAVNSYAQKVKSLALSNSAFSNITSNDETDKILIEVEKEMRRQAAMISK